MKLAAKSREYLWQVWESGPLQKKQMKFAHDTGMIRDFRLFQARECGVIGFLAEVEGI